MKINRLINRSKMCYKKASFQTEKAAVKVAKEHNQNVYECPICFCWHCTSQENWQLEFIPIDKYNEILEQLEKLKTKHLEHKKNAGKTIFDLQQLVGDRGKKLREVEHQLNNLLQEKKDE